jgi:hypothetical protein
MEADLFPVLSQLGVAAFAIYVMWQMSNSNTKERDKHLETSRLEREKFMLAINEATKAFNEFQEKVRTEIMDQLNKNTSAFQRVLDRFKD